VLKDRGQTLRFFRPQQFRSGTEVLHAFLAENGYELREPWRSSFAPGGQYEPAMHHFARLLEVMYDYVVLIPRWLFVGITGIAGTFLVNLFHRGDTKKAAEAEKRRAEAKARAEAQAAKAAGKSTAVVAKDEADASKKTGVASPSPAKKRKGKK
jgi:hypothetical protein